MNLKLWVMNKRSKDSRKRIFVIEDADPDIIYVDVKTRIYGAIVTRELKHFVECQISHLSGVKFL